MKDQIVAANELDKNKWSTVSADKQRQGCISEEEMLILERSPVMSWSVRALHKNLTFKGRERDQSFLQGNWGPTGMVWIVLYMSLRKQDPAEFWFQQGISWPPRVRLRMKLTVVKVPELVKFVNVPSQEPTMRMNLDKISNQVWHMLNGNTSLQWDIF